MATLDAKAKETINRAINAARTTGVPLGSEIMVDIGLAIIYELANLSATTDMNQHPLFDTQELVKDPVDPTKLMRMDVGLVATATTRVLSMPNADVQLLKHNLSATTDPGVTDDSDSFYGVGSMWANLALDIVWVCIDATVGAAIWVRLNIAIQFKTVSFVFYLENPLGTDSFPMSYIPKASTLIAVRAVTDIGTVDFNIEKRNKLTPDVAGTDVWSAEKVAAAAGIEVTAFDSGSVAEDEWLVFAASAAATGPTKLWITVEFTIDD